MMWNTRRNAHSAPGASCTAGLHKPRFIRRAILSRLPHNIIGCDPFEFSGFRSWSPCSLRTTPQLLRRTRWSPRPHLLRILSSSLLRAGSRAERWVNPVTRRGFASNTNTSDVSMGCARSITRTIRSVALAGTSAKNWLMCMNGKCRRRRDWWRSRWPGYVCLPLSIILERMLETSIFKTSSIGPVPMLNPCPFS